MKEPKINLDCANKICVSAKDLQNDLDVIKSIDENMMKHHFIIILILIDKNGLYTTEFIKTLEKPLVQLGLLVKCV